MQYSFCSVVKKLSRQNAKRIRPLPQSIIRRAADFALRQAIKIIKRPSRLFFLALSFWPRFASYFLPMLPDRWIRTPNGKTSCIETGYHLFQRDHPVEAWQWFERALRVGNPTADDNLLGAICLYHGLGRFRDAMSLLGRANERGIAETKIPDPVNNRFRVLDGFWARHIGDTADTRLRDQTWNSGGAKPRRDDIISAAREPGRKPLLVSAAGVTSSVG